MRLEGDGHLTLCMGLCGDFQCVTLGIDALFIKLPWLKEKLSEVR